MIQILTYVIRYNITWGSLRFFINCEFLNIQSFDLFTESDHKGNLLTIKFTLETIGG